MKNKLTIEQQLARRKYGVTNKFIWKTLVKCAMNPFIGRKYPYTLDIKDKISTLEGPAFIIYNHQSRVDYVWIANAAYPRQVNFVIGANEFYRSHLQGIFKVLNCVPKKNFTQDITSMRGMKSVIDKGGIIAFSPEGMSSITGHNQPIVNGTGRFFQHYNVPVYLFKIKGGFLTNHKVCLDDRRGRTDCELTCLLSKEDLKKYTPAEIDEKINDALWQDDYEWGQKQDIKWETHGNICSHLNDLIYRCPKCGHELEMDAEKNYIKCRHCGNGTTMNDFYKFEPFDENSIIPASPSKWVDWERAVVIDQIRKDDKFSYSVEVDLGCLDKYKYIKNQGTSKPCGKGIITVDHQGVHFEGVRDNQPYHLDWDYNTIWTLVIVTDVTFFSLYYKGEYLDFFPHQPVVGKILLLVEEMHRLHVNTWKNLPWFDFLYTNSLEENYERFFGKGKDEPIR